jgi:hypothetical protein
MTELFNPDEIVQARFFISIAAEGKQIKIAMGANADIINMPGRQAGFDELAPVGFAQVEVEPARRGRPRAEDVERMAGGRECRAHVLADLITRRADARSEGSAKSAGPATVSLGQSGHHAYQNPALRSAPAAMDSRNDALFVVGHQDGKAIGRFNNKKKARAVRRERVGPRPYPGPPGDENDLVPMNLFEQNDFKVS